LFGNLGSTTLAVPECMGSPMSQGRRFIALVLWSLSAPSAFGQTPQLLLFGGEDQKTFLGCLNCSPSDSRSICDQFGEYGSESNGESIWSQFGNFGSNFSNDSPWNQFSTSGPMVMDKSGQSYGRFTSNRSASDRTQIGALNRLTDLIARGTDLDKARDLFCANN
jgi:hypothetical protein